MGAGIHVGGLQDGAPHAEGGTSDRRSFVKTFEDLDRPKKCGCNPHCDKSEAPRRRQSALCREEVPSEGFEEQEDPGDAQGALYGGEEPKDSEGAEEGKGVPEARIRCAKLSISRVPFKKTCIA